MFKNNKLYLKIIFRFEPINKNKNHDTKKISGKARTKNKRKQFW